MSKLNKRTPVVFHVGCTLLCLVLFSTYLTGGLYARYTAHASGGDTARVAKFHISGSAPSSDGQEVRIELNFFDPDKLTDSLAFTVASDSEVAVRYSVIVTIPTGMAHYDWLNITLDDGTSATSAGNVFTISDAGTIPPHDNGERSHTLRFSVVDEYVGNPGHLTDLTEGAVLVTVRAEQID